MSLLKTGTARVQAIDILRGAVMVLMAIDHVRVYSGIPAGGPDPAIFFTRWVTHFCAPAFVFLAGTAAFFHGRKLGDTRALSRFLLTRGFVLVVLELTVIRFGWTFNLNFTEFALAGVIWMIGWCMLIMALLVRFSPAVVGTAGLLIIFFQQLFSFVPRLWPAALDPSLGGFWEFIYPSGMTPWPGISILYVLVPWIGVMAAGYGFGLILSHDTQKRKRLCKQIGFSAIAIFILAGTVMIMMKPSSPEAPPFIVRLLNQQKYPASQLYLLMTLGPLIALVPLAEKAKGKIAGMLTVFGRVPFFYYLLHIPLIHTVALLVNFIRVGDTHQEWYATAPYAAVPPDFRWSLGLLYLIFFIVVAVLYVACRWYMDYKTRHPEKSWLKYF